MNKPFVNICAGCQKEFPQVNAQVISHDNDTNFSHGYCPRHLLFHYKTIPNFSPQKLNALKVKFEQNKNTMLPDLAERPDIRKMYEQGIFSQEQMAHNMVERFQKLANIVKEIKNHASSSCN